MGKIYIKMLFVKFFNLKYFHLVYVLKDLNL